MKRLRLRLLSILIWSLMVRYLAWPLLHILALVSDRIKHQLKGRRRSQMLAVELATKRRGFDDCAVFFCSSAGEYEQAKPIIERLAGSSQMLCHVVFFSSSGVDFVRARKDDVSWSLAPPDDVFEWGTIFAALRPSVTFVVRHELWPAFLWSASQWSRVIVINAVVPALLGRQSEWREALSLMTKAWLLWFVDLVCVVTAEDRLFFEKRLMLPSDKVKITGDTKYDRVIERATTGAKKTENLLKIFRNSWCPNGTDIILVAGSVYGPDVELILEALNQDGFDSIRVVFVPHDVSSGNVAKIFDMISQRGYLVELLSELKAANFKFSNPQPRFVVIDEIGRLFDLYSVADLVWVGGAVHGKVHNVLEPAAWGLPVSCGSRVENSQEAIAMRGEGLLLTASTPDEVADRWRQFLDNRPDFVARTKIFAEKMAGASERVLRALQPNKIQGGAE